MEHGSSSTVGAGSGGGGGSGRTGVGLLQGVRTPVHTAID